MKIASWNVNGIISRRKALIKFLNKVKPDILCAQEIKTQCALNLPGYELYWNVSERKGYAGTLILTKRKPAAYQNGIGIEKFDAEARSITMEFKDYILVNVYVPSFNTASPPERRNFRLEWDAAFREYISRLQKPAILCGDYNVVRSPMDTYPDNSSSAADRPFSPEAEFIEGFEKLLELGYADVFRTLNPSTEGIYSWWGPKNKNRLYNRGSRLDYILVSNRLLGFTAGIKYHMNIQDPDHCPVTINISPPALYSEQIQEDLADKWRATDWQQMESILFDMQKELAQAADRRDWESVSQIQRKIEASWPARALAVRAVADKNTAAGVDGVKWETDAERAEAAKRLTVRNYHPLPYRHKEIVEGNGRTRTIHIPAARDQAMQILGNADLIPPNDKRCDKIRERGRWV